MLDRKVFYHEAFALTKLLDSHQSWLWLTRLMLSL